MPTPGASQAAVRAVEPPAARGRAPSSSSIGRSSTRAAAASRPTAARSGRPTGGRWRGRGAEGRRGDLARAGAGRRAAAGRPRPLHGRPRLGPPPPAHAHPHRPARPVRRRLARLRGARDRRQHGARRRADGLRVRADVGRARRRDRDGGERGARSAAATSVSTCCHASRRSRSPT